MRRMVAALGAVVIVAALAAPAPSSSHGVEVLRVVAPAAPEAHATITWTPGGDLSYRWDRAVAGSSLRFQIVSHDGHGYLCTIAPGNAVSDISGTSASCSGHVHRGTLRISFFAVPSTSAQAATLTLFYS